MSSKRTRREFLKVGVGGVVAAKTAKLARALPASMLSPSREISFHVTSGALRYHAEPSVAWKTGKAGENVIELEPGKKYQEILGFGAAFTDATCFTFNRRSEEHTSELQSHVNLVCRL